MGWMWISLHHGQEMRVSDFAERREIESLVVMIRTVPLLVKGNARL